MRPRFARLRCALAAERGTLTILITGVLVVILMVIGLGVSITGVALERNELQAAADGAALAASQAFDESDVYGPSAAGAAPGRITPGRAQARSAAQAYLRRYPVDSERTGSLAIRSLDVAQDGTVTVALGARTDPPLVSWFTRRTGTSVLIEATGHARST